MNTCEICGQTDTLTGINDHWFCVEHIAEGFKPVGALVQRLKNVHFGG